MGEETNKEIEKQQEFVKKYNELSKKYGYTIKPVIRLELTKIDDNNNNK